MAKIQDTGAQKHPVNYIANCLFHAFGFLMGGFQNPATHRVTGTESECALFGTGREQMQLARRFDELPPEK
jgi:hypothetical protein